MTSSHDRTQKSVFVSGVWYKASKCSVQCNSINESLNAGAIGQGMMLTETSEGETEGGNVKYQRAYV